mmetsp:Transcript_8456/g.19268  ORF Transcript_8456/g.19268 Transcript_8456/m.19268 type:complete len:83 (-) Transcript_8456:52-300(-)
MEAPPPAEPVHKTQSFLKRVLQDSSTKRIHEHEPSSPGLDEADHSWMLGGDPLSDLPKALDVKKTRSSGVSHWFHHRADSSS